ncbi:MAG TPA: transposase [Candidatus Limnocylindria bacterium]|nr:transposase [Candidatus Limnocylindria bacterium]
MRNEHRDSSDSTTLHLDQFAAGTPTQIGTETGLTVVIKRASAEAAEQSSTPILVPKEGGALPPKEMLGAVSYCYAKGVYESEEIERKMMHDPTLRESVHGEVPDANAIRRFRRLNRTAIQQTLEKAFGFIRRKQKADLLKPLPGQPTIPPAQATLDDSTVFYVKREAEERVQQAAFIDNMSKD